MAGLWNQVRWWFSFDGPSRHTHEYYMEPYRFRHFCHWMGQLAGDITWLVWNVPQFVFSRKYRIEAARKYNRALFGGIPTSQISVFDGDVVRPLRPEERTWPE